MIVTVRNATQFPILLDGTLFHPGKYVTVPATPILEGQSIKYELEPNNLGGGVNGGNAWMVVLDNVEGDTWTFAAGWIAPVRGERQAGVAESSDPQAGNSAATPEGNNITSTNTFKDKEGQSIKFAASVYPDFEDGTILFIVETNPA